MLVILFRVSMSLSLTHCGRVMPYSDTDLDQHWLKYLKWLVAWWHQAITWTNLGLSSVSPSDIHLKAISQEIYTSAIKHFGLKITYLRFHSKLKNYLSGISFKSPTYKCSKISQELAHHFEWWYMVYESGTEWNADEHIYVYIYIHLFSQKHAAWQQLTHWPLGDWN